MAIFVLYENYKTERGNRDSHSQGLLCNYQAGELALQPQMHILLLS